jgi:hypothetical protein
MSGLVIFVLNLFLHKKLTDGYVAAGKSDTDKGRVDERYRLVYVIHPDYVIHPEQDPPRGSKKSGCSQCELLNLPYCGQILPLLAWRASTSQLTIAR